MTNVTLTIAPFDVAGNGYVRFTIAGVSVGACENVNATIHEFMTSVVLDALNSMGMIVEGIDVKPGADYSLNFS